jgi:hypothetical protein
MMKEMGDGTKKHPAMAVAVDDLPQTAGYQS